MKKKTTKKKNKPKKQKIDVVIESLVHLEQRVKELTKKVEQLQYSQPYYPNPNYQYHKVHQNIGLIPNPLLNIRCNLTFVSSYQEAEQIKKELVNLGANESDIIIKFVSGPNKYLVQMNSTYCDNEFPEPLDKFLHDNEWVAFRKIKYDKEKNEYL